MYGVGQNASDAQVRGAVVGTGVVVVGAGVVVGGRVVGQGVVVVGVVVVTMLQHWDTEQPMVLSQVIFSG